MKAADGTVWSGPALAVGGTLGTGAKLMTTRSATEVFTPSLTTRSQLNSWAAVTVSTSNEKLGWDEVASSSVTP